MPIVHDDADPVTISPTDILGPGNGGSGSDMSATGPGLVKQATAGADFTIQTLAKGEIPYGDFNGQPASLAANNTSTKKYLLERSLIANQPFPSWAALDADDLASGEVSLARGGTGADLSATGPGVLQQASATENVTIQATTGTGDVVRTASPTITSPTVTGTIAGDHSASGTVQFDGTVIHAGSVSTFASLFTLIQAPLTIKKAQFNLTAISTGATRVFSLPNYDGTLATVGGTETLSAKTLASPTITGSIILPGGVTISSGSGTPEGAVAAVVGSTFHRTDGGAGTSFYVKESGSGNTGWVAK